MGSIELLLVLIFVTVTMVVLGTISLVNDLLTDRYRVQQRVTDEFGLGPAGSTVQKSNLFKDLDQLAPELFSGDLAKPTVRRRFEVMVEQSGIVITAEQLLMACGLFGLLCGLFVSLIKWSIPLGILTGLVSWIVPLLFVRSRWKARLNKLKSQLPDAFELMGRVIRVGQTMPQALLAAAQESQPPLATEFALCYEQQNLGLSFEMALRNLATRTGLLELKILVMALLVQQETGGNLAQVLDNLAELVRSRLQLRDKVRVLTAEGRAQAVALLSLPFIAFLIMFVLNREYAMVLLHNPNLLGGMLVSMALGAWWIKKIITIDL